MANELRGLSVVFAAGAAGAVVNSLAVWAVGHWGLAAAAGVKIAPALTPGFLYPRIVWGGLWGLLFLLPLARGSLFWRGLILSLGPTAVQLLMVFPYQAGKGMFGLELGLLTPLFVLVYNAIWGWTAAIWLRIAR